VGVFSYVLANAPTPLASRLGIRGLKRARSLRNPWWADVEPLVRWVAGRVSPLLGRSKRRLDLQISLAGYPAGVIPEEYVALCMLSAFTTLCLGSFVCALTHEPKVWAALAGLIGGALPWLHFSGETQRRSQSIQNGLPYAVDLLALSLGAGLDFPGALRQVVDKASDPCDPLIGEINYILQELLVGKTRRQALLEFSERCPYEAVIEFTGAVVQAEERGNPLAAVLQIQATSSRARRSVRAEESAAKASLQMLVPCLLVFVSVLLIIVAPLFLALVSAN
jgi:tight adherence protein C